MPGATALGLTYNGGVILAAEKRISYGNFVVNKNTKKIFPVTDRVTAACAGMVADMQVLIRQVTALAKIRKLETRREVATNSIAKTHVSYHVRKEIFSTVNSGHSRRDRF